MKKPAKSSVRECLNVPRNPSTNIVLRLIPKNPDGAYYAERTDRNIGWITREEQNTLKNTVIGIAGCGGMGAQLAEKFLRLGVGEIRIADNETFDVSNINRQFAASRKTVGVSKAFATARMLRDVSDDSTVVVYPKGICESSVDDFVKGCDVICDEIEFWAVGPRILLHQTARREGVPVFNCNTVGFGTRLFLFTPESVTMEEVLEMTLDEGMILSHALQAKTASKEQTIRVMQSMLRGLVPSLPDYYLGGGNAEIVRERLFKEGRASIIATNPPLATGFLADRVLLYLLKDSPIKRTVVETPAMPAYLYFDAAHMVANIYKGKWWQDASVKSPINITLVTDDTAIKAVLTFIARIAKERHNAAPPPAPEVLFAAIDGDTIVGSIALDFGKNDGSLPLEEIYAFAHDPFSGNFKRNETAQYGRWMASVEGISPALAYIATVYALQNGKTHGWFEAKPFIADRLKEIGMDLSPLEGTSLLLDRIPPEGRAYYTKAPLPQIYTMSLEPFRRALLPQIKALIKNGAIVIDRRFID